MVIDAGGHVHAFFYVYALDPPADARLESRGDLIVAGLGDLGVQLIDALLRGGHGREHRRHVKRSNDLAFIQA